MAALDQTDFRTIREDGTRVHVLENAAHRLMARPQLTIAIPFYRDDATRLVSTLNRVIGHRKSIQILLLDDGAPDADLNEQTARTLLALTAPAMLLTASHNLGRAAGRNTLAAFARGDWTLFLDADMELPHDDFVDHYLDAIEIGGFDAAFGGFETETPDDHSLALHAALTQGADEAPAFDRQRTGATAFCSSNLLVRTRVMALCGFDEGFTGWGWEDVEWAVRAAKTHTLIHLDNPARHQGLQGADTLLAKFRDGAINYARLLELHPELVSLPSYKAARLVGRLPLAPFWRTIWSVMTRAERLPLRLRALSLKLWRASWAAEALRTPTGEA